MEESTDTTVYVPRVVTDRRARYSDARHTYVGAERRAEIRRISDRESAEWQISRELNVWGTRKSDVGEGFCRECEHENPGHYTNCPLYARGGF